MTWSLWVQWNVGKRKRVNPQDQTCLPNHKVLEKKELVVVIGRWPLTQLTTGDLEDHPAG